MLDGLWDEDVKLTSGKADWFDHYGRGDREINFLFIAVQSALTL